MEGGRRLAPSPSILEIRDRARLALSELPDTLGQLDQAEPYEVRISGALERLAQQADRYT